jgi:SWI/SNF-related matrix-associated actin-dependent regulator 1 of chromatin subfamily A
MRWVNIPPVSSYKIHLRGCLGLGKTVQVISLFALLKERGIKGPHLIVVP